VGLFRGRKGSTQRSYFVMIDLILLFLIAVGFLAFVAQVSSSTLFEKNYLARDLALLVDTAYAAPGSVNYLYEGNASRFVLAFEGNRVRVRLPRDVVANEYWFADAGQGTLSEQLDEPDDVVLVGINSQVLVRDRVIS